MNDPRWTAVDDYISEALFAADEALPNVRGVRRLHEFLRTESRVSATTNQTVACKAYDGFTLAYVTGTSGHASTS